MAELLYLKLSESCLAEKRKVKIKDVATVLSPNPDIKYGVEKLELMSFSGSKEQQVISVMYILQVIQEHYPDCQTQTIGATDVVVYYRTYDTSDKVKQFFKFLMICFIAFSEQAFPSCRTTRMSIWLDSLTSCTTYLWGRAGMPILWRE